MFILDLFEEVETMDTLVVYPGRFQPWHRGHHAVYNYLVSNFGRDRVFIATSNKVDPPRSPFSFSEKLQFMALTGIAGDVVVETRDPYKVPELVQTVNAERTRLIFAVSQKDMDEDPRFKFGTKKDGSPTYFQPMPKNAYDMQSLSKHAYIMVVPTFEFKVLGQPMRSATEIRAQFSSADETTQKSIVKDLFGSYSPEVHAIMKNKLSQVAESITKENDSDDIRPPGAPAAQVSQTLSKLQRAMSGPNKFIWRRPNQMGSVSVTDRDLLNMGFRKSYNGSWGGTQAMWNRLMGIKEGEVIHGKFGGPYYKDPNIKIPMYDPVRGVSVAGDRLKGNEVPFKRFITKPALFGRAFNIVGVTSDNKYIKISTTPSKELADTLVDAYNRGGFTPKKLEKVPLKQAFKPKDEA